MKNLTYILIIMVFGVLSGCSSKNHHSEYYLLVGTYTQKPSQGIYVYRFNADDGRLTYVSKAAGVRNPSYLAVSPDQDYVYAVNELGKKGSVSSFSFNQKTGKLTFINKQSSKGGPCYVAVDRTGKYIFTANYGNGSFCEFAINKDGSLRPAMLTIQDHGSSVNKQRQSSPHVHCTHLTPDNKFLIVNDLGTDYVSQYAFNASSGELNTDPVHQYKVHPGAGPRHITFAPSGKYAYLVTEMGGTIVAFAYSDQKLNHIQTISAVPGGFDGKISGGEVRVSPDGGFLYVSMRKGLNDIVIFRINQESGKLTLAGRQPTEGVQPRNFMIDPTGKYLLVANKNSDNIVVFKRNPSTGKLKQTGTEINVSMPVCLKMIPVK